LFTLACTQHRIIPNSLEEQVDRGLDFDKLKQNADHYRGRLLLAGGKVLSAKQLQEGTRIEILQMPLSKDLVPDETRMDSEGRFVAMDFDKRIADPALLEANNLLTLVAEVLGMETIVIDEVKQQVPKLAVKHMTVWERDRLAPYGLIPYSWGYGHPFYVGRSF
jgi:outer membrane lipoprotein